MTATKQIQVLRDQLSNLANAAAIVCAQFRPLEDTAGAGGKALLFTELQETRKVLEQIPNSNETVENSAVTAARANLERRRDSHHD